MGHRRCRRSSAWDHTLLLWRLSWWTDGTSVVHTPALVPIVRPPQHELHSRAHTREETEVEDEQWTRVLPATNAPAAERPVCWLY
ncbi:hypothetical protein BDA96_03G156400 [Sorghum bicolor]|uniref:Secreted protein n=1 Tax=Sorghum bicolor TaxID=4558 RepID=A0A921RCW3_SORBI|nr:hypothetical protein BDA96_03G156400 [Sorghum bicolor]